jgi:c-di-GMP-related signal transduction protein
MTEAKEQGTGLTLFIARQPIFDREKQVCAYELLYPADLVNRADMVDNEHTTLKVIANSLLIGLQKLTAGKRAYIHFNRQLLMAQIPLLFPKEILGVEIFETVKPEERIIKTCERLKAAGYLVVVDDLALNEPYSPLLHFADIVKIDFSANSPGKRESIARQAVSRKLTLLAEKIDSQRQYQEALDMGCCSFQGFFFQEADLVTHRVMAGYKWNYLRILGKIHTPLLELSDIEAIIKRDVSLTYKMLRFINSASFGFRVTIRSIHHALVLLGKREIKKWLTIIVMSGIGEEKPLELMNVAVIRARFCELIAARFKLLPESSEFFLVGMFSLLESFLDRPMSEILEELPLGENVKSALLGENNRLGEVLDLVKTFEKGNWEAVSQYVRQLNLEKEKLALLYLEAVEWAKFLSKEPDPL